MCVFDFNNLRTINNNLGHDKGDEYIKMEEAAAKQKMNIQILENINAQGYAFSSCMCCDALLDQYYVLRAGSKFFLADDGSYSGAVEQIIQELSTEENRKNLRRQLQIEYLSEHLTKDSGKFELPYQYQYGENVYRGRMTILYLNGTEDGRLHHFILGFETFQNETEENEKRRLTRYYEQLRQP